MPESSASDESWESHEQQASTRRPDPRGRSSRWASPDAAAATTTRAPRRTQRRRPPRAPTSSAIKDYLLAHTERLVTDTGTLRADAEAYYALAKGADFDYGKLLADKRSEVAASVKKLQDDFAEANPAYEEMEGVVAGVPVARRLRRDHRRRRRRLRPRERRPVLGQDARRAHVQAARATSTTSSRPAPSAPSRGSPPRASSPTSTATASVEFGEALPDADFLVAAARDFETAPRSSTRPRASGARRSRTRSRRSS